MADEIDMAAPTDVAVIVDHTVTATLQFWEESGQPGEVVAGAVFALVRHCANTMAGPRTPRQIMSLLLPAINNAAEQACTPTTPKADA